MLKQLQEFKKGGLSSVINFTRNKKEELLVGKTKLLRPFIFGVPALPPTGGRPVLMRPVPQSQQHLNSGNSNQISPTTTTSLPVTTQQHHRHPHHHTETKIPTNPPHDHSIVEIKQFSSLIQLEKDLPALPPPYEGPAEIVFYEPVEQPEIPLSDYQTSGHTASTSIKYSVPQELPAVAPEYVAPKVHHDKFEYYVASEEPAEAPTYEPKYQTYHHHEPIKMTYGDSSAEPAHHHSFIDAILDFPDPDYVPVYTPSTTSPPQTGKFVVSEELPAFAPAYVAPVQDSRSTSSLLHGLKPVGSFETMSFQKETPPNTYQVTNVIADVVEVKNPVANYQEIQPVDSFGDEVIVFNMTQELNEIISPEKLIEIETLESNAGIQKLFDNDNTETHVYEFQTDEVPVLNLDVNQLPLPYYETYHSEKKDHKDHKHESSNELLMHGLTPVGHFEPPQPQSPPELEEGLRNPEHKSDTSALKEESEDLTSLFPYYDDLIQDMVSETEKDIEITEVETNDNDISLETDIEQFEPEESLMDGLTPVGKLDTEKDDSDLITKIDPEETVSLGLRSNSDPEDIISLDGEEIRRDTKDLENLMEEIMDKLEISEDYDEGIYDSQDHLLLPLYDYV